MLPELINEIVHVLLLHFPKTYDIKRMLTKAIKIDVNAQFKQSRRMRDRKFTDFTNLIPPDEYTWYRYNIRNMNVGVLVIHDADKLKQYNITVYHTIFEWEGNVFIGIPNIVFLNACGEYENSSERISSFQYPVLMLINEWNKPGRVIKEQDDGYYILTPTNRNKGGDVI